MERLVKGGIVVVPFPFSNLSRAKRRPAMVVADLAGDDVVLAQITSRNVRDRYSIPIDGGDFRQGSLKVASNVRPNRLFTADKAMVLYKAGRLGREKVDQIIDAIVEIVRG